MCDLACPNSTCGELLVYLRAVAPPPGHAIISLCMFCGQPCALVAEDQHLLVRELDTEQRQALLMDPTYQRLVFERAMGGH